MGRKPRQNEPAVRVISLRITERQFAAWPFLAKKRKKSLRDMIRDGVDAVTSRMCCCEPGQPMCAFCLAATDQ